MAYKTWNVGDVLTSADMNTYVRDQAPTTCTSSTRPTGVADGKMIYETDTDRTYVYDGSSWVLIGGGAWSSFAVTWTGATTNPVLGNGTLNGYYQQCGKTVLYRIELTAGSTTTFGSGTWIFSLPVAAKILAGAGGAHGVAAMFDGVSSRAFRFIFEATTTTIQLMDAAGATVNSATPWAWNSGDAMVISGSYEAA